MDLAIGLAEQTGPDLVIANDPDADRCAAAIPDRAAGGCSRRRDWTLLGAHLLARGVPEGAASPVLSRQLPAARRDVPSGRRPPTRKPSPASSGSPGPGLAYGYEEALGYCVAPDLVRDKDGITAALLLADSSPRRARPPLGPPGRPR